MPLDLRILLLGGNVDITKIGNSLLGGDMLTNKKEETQHHSLKLEDERHIQITAPRGGQYTVSDGDGCRLSDGLVSELESSDYHAVVFAMEIDTNLNLMYPREAVECMLKDDSWKDLIQKKCVIIVREAGRFTEARDTGKISMTFLKWMRQQTAVVGTLFQEVQERCLLFATDGPQDVLARQRADFVYMMDSQVLVGEHYAKLKFQMMAERSAEIEKQLLDFKKQVTETIPELDGTEKSNFIQIEKMMEVLGVHISDLKTNFLEENTESTNDALATAQQGLAASKEV